MIKKLLVAVLVILLLFGICATLEKEVSPDGTATETEAIWQMAIQSLSDSFGQIKDGIVGIFKSVTSDDEDGSSETTTEIGEVSVDELPKEAQEYYRRYVEDGWQTTSSGLEGKTQAGGDFNNDPNPGETKLPELTDDGEKITYKEFDAETTLKGKRGKKRFVHGSDNSTYYTDDHYKTYNKVLN